VQSAAFGRNATWVGTWVFMPSSVLVPVAGALRTEDGNWSWSEPFVVLGLVGWALVAGVAFGYVMPSMTRLGMRMAEEGPNPELVAGVQRVVLIARVSWRCSS